MAYERDVKIDKGLWDAYKHYKHKKVVPTIDRATYVKIVHDINKKISKAIIEESLEFKIPFHLGMLSIKKNKLKIRIKDGKLLKPKMVVDWEASWKMWMEDNPGLTHNEIKKLPGKQVIYQTNEHTNGYIMGWKWAKSMSRFRNSSVYMFKPTKQNRIDLGRWIKSGDRENDYYLSDTGNKYGNKRI